MSFKLVTEYPKLFKQYRSDIKDLYSNWVFECEPGWYDIIDNLCKKIAKVTDKVEFIQIKEKFGSLRIYVDLDNAMSEEQASTVYSLIKEAEELSTKTCELCGKVEDHNIIRNDFAWYMARCDDCWGSRKLDEREKEIA